ncbi:MAG: hypothetical protein VXW87_00815, partial [Pseudomonadota bacterium]|nr:hypothetical protein [Pseudomonadota bacterium]
MRCFRSDLKTKLKDAYALRFLGDPSMFHFLFTAFEQELLHLPILKKHVQCEISDILSEQANIDEIYRGNIERNITQVSRGYAENL